MSSFEGQRILANGILTELSDLNFLRVSCKHYLSAFGIKNSIKLASGEVSDIPWFKFKVYITDPLARLNSTSLYKLNPPLEHPSTQGKQ